MADSFPGNAGLIVSRQTETAIILTLADGGSHELKDVRDLVEDLSRKFATVAVFGERDRFTRSEWRALHDRIVLGGGLLHPVQAGESREAAIGDFLETIRRYQDWRPPEFEDLGDPPAELEEDVGGLLSEAECREFLRQRFPAEASR
jgi:hypothetical protein